MTNINKEITIYGNSVVIMGVVNNILGNIDFPELKTDKVNIDGVSQILTWNSLKYKYLYTDNEIENGNCEMRLISIVDIGDGHYKMGFRVYDLIDGCDGYEQNLLGTYPDCLIRVDYIMDEECHEYCMEKPYVKIDNLIRSRWYGIVDGEVESISITDTNLETITKELPDIYHDYFIRKKITELNDCILYMIHYDGRQFSINSESDDDSDEEQKCSLEYESHRELVKGTELMSKLSNIHQEIYEKVSIEHIPSFNELVDFFKNHIEH